MTVRQIILLISPLALAGCATALRYGPESVASSSGYAEEPVGRGLFRVTFSAPDGTPVSRIERLALRRAAEFTLDHGSRYFALRGRRISRGVYVIGSAPGLRVTYGGGYAEWRSYWHFYCFGRGFAHCEDDPLWLSAASPRRRTEVALTIELASDAGRLSPALDARLLLSLLEIRR